MIKTLKTAIIGNGVVGKKRKLFTKKINNILKKN